MTILIGACTSHDRGDDDCGSGKCDDAPFQFRKEPGAIVLAGGAGAPMFASDPAVYRDDEGYHLFHTNIFCKKDGAFYFSHDPANPDECPIAGEVVGTLAYAFSADRGLTWTYRETPLVLPDPEAFDGLLLETASVSRIGDKLVLVYSGQGLRDGQPFPQRYQIGLATLDLGGATVREALLVQSKSFVKRKEPLLPYDLREGRFDNNVQEPSVVIRDGVIELFYIGLGLKFPEELLSFPGQAITAVGLGKATLDENLAVVSRSETPILGGAGGSVPRTQVPNITEVHYFDNRYHVFSTITPEDEGDYHEDEKINYFTSPDLVDWSDGAVLLERNEASGAFDSWGVVAPTVAVEQDSLVMFYWAVEKRNNPCLPIPAGGRFGIDEDVGPSACIYSGIGRAVAPRYE